MTLKSVVKVLTIVALVVVFSTLAAQAQGPVKDVAPDVADAAAVDGPAAGVGSPPPAGFTVLYMFTGVANESDGGNDEATSINCTNYHATTAVEVRAEVYSYDPGSKWALNQVIPAGSTRTWSTQSILAFNDGGIFPAVGYIFQGSGRILVRQHSKVICSAQVLDANADPPIYAVDLEMFQR